MTVRPNVVDQTLLATSGRKHSTNSPSASGRSTMPYERRLVFPFALFPCPRKRARIAYAPLSSNTCHFYCIDFSIDNTRLYKLSTTYVSSREDINSDPPKSVHQPGRVTFNVRSDASLETSNICSLATHLQPHLFSSVEHKHHVLFVLASGVTHSRFSPHLLHGLRLRASNMA